MKTLMGEKPGTPVKAKAAIPVPEDEAANPEPDEAATTGSKMLEAATAEADSSEHKASAASVPTFIKNDDESPEVKTGESSIHQRFKFSGVGKRARHACKNEFPESNSKVDDVWKRFPEPIDQ
jgi:hypothetical protein